MYDWDQDQDDLAREALAPRYVGSVPEVQGDHRQALKWILPLLGGAVVSLGAMAVIPSPPLKHDSPSFAGTLAPVQLQGTFELAEIPEALVVYDRERAIEFLTGLQRFSDADLHSFAEISAQAVAQPGTVLLIYWKDALALTLSEIERRGLAPPVKKQAPEAAETRTVESLAMEQG